MQVFSDFLRGCSGQFDAYRYPVIFRRGVGGNLVHIGILWFFEGVYRYRVVFEGITGAIWCM